MGMTLENFDALDRSRTRDGDFEIDPTATFEETQLESARDL